MHPPVTDRLFTRVLVHTCTGSLAYADACAHNAVEEQMSAGTGMALSIWVPSSFAAHLLCSEA